MVSSESGSDPATPSRSHTNSPRQKTPASVSTGPKKSKAEIYAQLAAKARARMTPTAMAPDRPEAAGPLIAPLKGSVHSSTTSGSTSSSGTSEDNSVPALARRPSPPILPSGTVPGGGIDATARISAAFDLHTPVFSGRRSEVEATTLSVR